MIELPEATTIARQITGTLKGKRIGAATRGNAPHKFAFYNRAAEEYAAILPGRVVGDSWPHGSCIMVAAEPDYVLELGGGGERIRYHDDGSTLPARHQLLLGFVDGSYLSVTVQGWGSAQLRDRAQLEEMPPPPERRVSPLDDAFTYDYFRGLFADLRGADPRSVKSFAISQPGIWGVGNGCLHDILFRAGLHPRHPAAATTEEERRAFYGALRETLRQAAALGGRDTEQDLFGAMGHYQVLLDRRTRGCPCPRCGAAIEAISYLGGRSYYCPRCQR